MILKRNILLIATLLLSNFIFSQQFQITGKIVNEKSNPVEFTEILLLTQDSIAIKSELSDAQGIFSIQTTNGNYILQVKHLKDIIYSKNISLQNSINLGNIQIDKIQQIKEVVVEGKKKLIERKVDRLVFNVENSISATGGDALDALKITPRIKVKNDQISMIGKNGMSVMIDDRLIQLSGDDLINFLKTIKSDNIKSIEVITNPPAKYDAEGNNGMVNIKLKKAKADSWSNTIRTTYKQATYPSFSVGNNFTYQKNKLSFLFDVDYRKNQDIYTNDVQYNYPLNFWQQSIYEKSVTNGIGGTINIGYKANETLQLGLQYFGFATDANKKNNNISNIFYYDEPNEDRILSNGITDRTNSSSSLNFNVIKKLSNSNKKLTFDIDYFNLNTGRDNNFNTEKFSESESSSEFAINNSKQKVENISSKIDFELPFNWVNLNAGAKISYTKSNNDIDYSEYNSANNSLILTQKDIFKYKENTQSLYISSDKKIKKWQFKLGIRAEFTQNEGYSKNLNQVNKNDYVKLFPTLFILYDSNKNNAFSFSYGRRIKRPDFSFLNPAKWYFNSNSYEEGNPFLQPSYTNNFEISHTYNDLLTSSISFSKTEDGFGQIVTHSTNNGSDDTQVFIRRNYYNGSSLNFTEELNFDVFKWWNTNSSISVFYNETNTFSEYLFPMFSGWGGDFTTTNSFIISKDKSISAQLIYNYTYPSIQRESRISDFYNLSIGVKASLFKKNLQLAVFANNILRSDIEKINSISGNVSQSFKQYYDTQYIRLSLSYKFGNKNISGSKRKTSNEDEKGRAN